MKLFRWLPGRQQNCEYYKFCFLYFKIGRFGFDGYILKYLPKTELPWHKDPINGKMWRLNIRLWGKSLLVIDPGLMHMHSYYAHICLFRPDICGHKVINYTKTYKLSLGFAKFNTQNSIIK